LSRLDGVRWPEWKGQYLTIYQEGDCGREKRGRGTEKEEKKVWKCVDENIWLKDKIRIEYSEKKTLSWGGEKRLGRRTRGG